MILSDSERENASNQRYLLKTIDLRSREEEFYLVSAFSQKNAWETLSKLHPGKLVCIEGKADLQGEVCQIQ